MAVDAFARARAIDPNYSLAAFWHLAFLQVALGDDEAAIGRLEQGLRQHSRWMALLAVPPVVDPLRGNPRFQRILRAMRLPEIS